MSSTIYLRCKLAAIAMIVASSVAACGSGAAAAAENKPAADEATAAWVKAFNGGDAAAIAALYADDAQSIPPSGGVNKGRSDIETYWREDIGSGGDVTTLTVNSSGGGTVTYANPDRSASRRGTGSTMPPMKIGRAV